MSPASAQQWTVRWNLIQHLLMRNIYNLIFKILQRIQNNNTYVYRYCKKWIIFLWHFFLQRMIKNFKKYVVVLIFLTIGFNDNFLTIYYISWREEQKYTFLKIFFAYQRYAKFEFGPFEPQVMSSWHEISKCIFTKFEPPILNFCILIYILGRSIDR